MIKSFKCTDTQKLFDRLRVLRFANIERIARRKLLQINAAAALSDLAIPPGNRLGSIKGDRGGQQSIRVNSQRRICFAWRDGDAYEVEIVDYH